MERVGVIDTLTQTTCVHFDTIEGLLWIGTDMGRVLSLVPPNLALHTCGFVARGDSVRQIVSADKGIVALTDYTVSMRSRHSLVPAWKLDSSGNDSFQSMCIVDSNLIVSTSLGALVVVGLRSGTIMKSFALADGSSPPYVIMKRDISAKTLICATAAGSIHIRDLKTASARILHRFDAHSGMISDIDLSGSSMLATCGYSLPAVRGGSMQPDCEIKLFDLRNVAASSKSPKVVTADSNAPPSFVKFGIGKGRSALFASQLTGELFRWDNVTHFVSPSLGINTELDGYIIDMEVCSTGDYVAIVSSAGTVSLWSDKPVSTAQVNVYERPITTVDPLPPTQKVGPNTPLSVIGMPYYTEALLSAMWPPNLTFDITNYGPTRIPKEILQEVKMSDFVGYAKNPGTTGFRRNQSTKSMVLQAQARQEQEGGLPKFRSEQEREERLGKGSRKPGVYGARDSPILEASSTFSPSQVPKPYRRVQIKYSKFGIEDFDFAFFNKSSHFSGLETHIKNSYTNSLLQLLFYTIPLRKIAFQHISSVCSNQTCLFCELGFLFKMLEDAKGQNCHAGNFLHVFGKRIEAGALGLFENDAIVVTSGAAPTSRVPAQNFNSMIHRFHRFILEAISGEGGPAVPGFVKPDPEKHLQPNDCTAIQDVMGLRLEAYSKCLGCGYEETRETVAFVVDLTVKLKTDDGSGDGPESPSFSTLLQGSLQKEANSKAWCIACKKNPTIMQTKRLKDLPNYLSMNITATGSEDLESVSEENEDLIPWRFSIVLNDDGVVVRDVSKDPINLSSFEVGAVYELKSVISEIKEDDRSHLVAHVSVDTNSDWLLFNDFSVEPIPSSDVRQFAKWKVPSILQYARVDLDILLDFSVLKPSNNLERLLLENPILNPFANVDLTYHPLDQSELPLKKGQLLAIDAEFVTLQKEEMEIHSDGSRSVLLPAKLGLARVSVLRGEDGPGLGIPLIDDYIAIQDEIVDYLTEYSGIQVGDLNPKTSTHALVELKVAYRKLRYLVDAGCIFIGHGLSKDFRTMNIIVPPDQIIDTVDIYFIKDRQRKLSLRYLAWSVLNLEIQDDRHDSIEDARTALLLYKKYLHMKRDGVFEQTLEEIYEEGRRMAYALGSIVQGTLPSLSNMNVLDGCINNLQMSVSAQGFVDGAFVPRQSAVSNDCGPTDIKDRFSRYFGDHFAWTIQQDAVDELSILVGQPADLKDGTAWTFHYHSNQSLSGRDAAMTPDVSGDEFLLNSVSPGTFSAVGDFKDGCMDHIHFEGGWTPIFDDIGASCGYAQDLASRLGRHFDFDTANLTLTTKISTDLSKFLVFVGAPEYPESTGWTLLFNSMGILSSDYRRKAAETSSQSLPPSSSVSVSSSQSSQYHSTTTTISSYFAETANLSSPWNASSNPVSEANTITSTSEFVQNSTNHDDVTNETDPHVITTLDTPSISDDAGSTTNSGPWTEPVPDSYTTTAILSSVVTDVARSMISDNGSMTQTCDNSNCATADETAIATKRIPGTSPSASFTSASFSAMATPSWNAKF